MNLSDIKIFTTFDSFEADQVVATLEYYGIPSYRKVKGSGQYIGIIMGHMTTHEISIFVPDEAADEAVNILTDAGFLREESGECDYGCESRQKRRKPDSAGNSKIRKENAMKEVINITEYANLITKALPKGILLNTNGDKFNAMVIGWGHLGTLWSLPTFHVYVRKGRYTRSQLDKTAEFTISVPLENADPNINRICGSMSGYNVDKVQEAGLTLVDPEVNHTPGIREYPLTIECKVLYAQELELAKMPRDIQERYYPQDVPGTSTGSNCDTHIMYVGQIVAAYINKGVDGDGSF